MISQDEINAAGKAKSDYFNGIAQNWRLDFEYVPIQTSTQNVTNTFEASGTQTAMPAITPAPVYSGATAYATPQQQQNPNVYQNLGGAMSSIQAGGYSMQSSSGSAHSSAAAGGMMLNI